MNEEEKISRKMLIFMFICCLLLLALVALFCVGNSPKTVAPTFSEALEEESYPEYSSLPETEENNSESENQSAFPIDINTASSEELQLIPDIGPATAQLIIDYRDENGTIVAFRELLSINGIGEKTVEILKEYCIIK